VLTSRLLSSEARKNTCSLAGKLVQRIADGLGGDIQLDRGAWRLGGTDYAAQQHKSSEKDGLQDGLGLHENALP
jgi:hypothetical protein